jgi:release factor glutamine methyltransferase
MYDPEESDQVMLLAFEHVKGFSRADIILEKLALLQADEQDRLLKILSGLQSGKPIQQVLGYAWFLSEKFVVDENVLIPRPETGELVRWIIHDYSLQRTERLNILDICTGSGCIAVSLALNSISWQLSGVDISGAALEIASLNSLALKREVRFNKGDLLNFEKDQVLKSFYGKDLDIVVCNPPYIPLSEAGTMHPRVRDHEPHIALFVSGDDPLLFYRKLLEYSSLVLRKGGKLYVELHYEYGDRLLQLFRETGFSDVILKKDLFGRDRMISAVFM